MFYAKRDIPAFGIILWAGVERLNIWQAVFLGAVQGLTEFLPVSSSGHLVLLQSLLKIKAPGITFEVMVHAGTLLAVLVFYFRDLCRIVASFFAELLGLGPRTRGGKTKGVWRNPDSRLALLVAVGTIPAVTVALLLGSKIEQVFSSPALVAGALLVTGLVLWVSEGSSPGRRKERDLKVGDALVVGCFQAAALLPGLSRSGLTIAAGLRRRFDRPLAARFSFLLSIPAVGGAVVLDVARILESGLKPVWPTLLAGTAAAFVTGIVAIRLVVGIVKAGRLRHFAAYCWLAGTLALVYYWMARTP